MNLIIIIEYKIDAMITDIMVPYILYEQSYHKICERVTTELFTLHLPIILAAVT